MRAVHVIVALVATSLWFPAPVSTPRQQPRPTIRISEQNGELLLEVGPNALAPDVDSMGMASVAPATLYRVAFPAAGWMRGFTVDMVDDHGVVVGNTFLHHVNLIVPSKRELFSGIMLRIGASGPETSPVILPRLMGYRVAAGDSLLVVTMFHNPTPTPRVVTLRVHIPFTRSGSFIGAVSIVPFYLDVTPPAASHTFDIPTGHSEQYWEAKPAIDGRILGVSGHLNKYGVLLRLEDRTAGKVIWETKPQTDTAGNITGMPIKKFILNLGVSIHSDHVYRLTSIYENRTGAPVLNAGMGALGGVFRPSHDWPALDPTNPDYLLDLQGLSALGDGMAAPRPPGG